jgi:hypothetical protein
MTTVKSKIRLDIARVFIYFRRDELYSQEFHSLSVHTFQETKYRYSESSKLTQRPVRPTSTEPSKTQPRNFVFPILYIGVSTVFFQPEDERITRDYRNRIPSLSLRYEIANAG